MSSRRAAKPARKPAAQAGKQPGAQGRRPPMRKPVAGTPRWVAPVAVLAAVAVLVAAFLVYRYYNTASAPAPLPADTTSVVVSQITGVPASEFEAIGQGGATNLIKPVSGQLLTGTTGKPEVLYIGAEYCPYCAAMRWSMAVALSRFGTLTPLHGIHSSSTDVNPNTATLTFYKSGYHSKYLSFTPVEVQTVSRAPLQSPTKAQNAVWAKYEPDPQTRGYPFIAFSNKQVMKGPIYDAAVLQGKSWSQIAAALTDTTSPVSQGVLGAANYITGAICQMTNDQPANVCNSAAVTAVKSRL